MKNRFSRLWSALLALTLALGFTAAPSAPWTVQPVLAADLPTTSRDDAPEAVKTAVANLICAFGNEDDLGITKYLEELKTLSPDEWYPIYSQVIDYWRWIENEMTENLDAAPQGIDDPAHHVFVVLGFALNDDGTMTDELKGRLAVAKNSLDEYPEARVLVTGGVEKNGWTEGQRMHDWLMENGIDESRIYVEKQAPDTAGNATNSFNILYNAGDVNTVSLITSQYHLKRGSILYYTESLLKAKEMGKDPIEFLGDFNAGWLREDKTSEPLSTKANSMYSIARVTPVQAPALNTEVTDLDVIFPNGNTYVQGSPLDCVVKTIDTKFENLTVTDFCTFTGYDPAKVGEQTVNVSFTANGKTTSKDFTVKVVYPDYKQDLAKLLADAALLNKDDYTEDSWTPVAEDMKDAQVILADVNASKPRVIIAHDSLKQAIENLVKKSDDNKNPDPKDDENKDEFTVVFKDKDGKVLSTQKVKKGEDAKAPEAPKVDGYTFDKWDKDYTKIQSDLEVKAVYKKDAAKADDKKTAAGGFALSASLFAASACALMSAALRKRNSPRA